MMVQLMNIMIFIFKELDINLLIHPQIPCLPPNTSLTTGKTQPVST